MNVCSLWVSCLITFQVSQLWSKTGFTLLSNIHSLVFIFSSLDLHTEQRFKNWLCHLLHIHLGYNTAKVTDGSTFSIAWPRDWALWCSKSSFTSPLFIFNPIFSTLTPKSSSYVSTSLKLWASRQIPSAKSRASSHFFRIHWISISSLLVSSSDPVLTEQNKPCFAPSNYFYWI